jgi:Rrf2 family protein
MLSSTAEYALRIMIVLAEQKDTAQTSAQIAEATRVSSDYAVKILQWLGRAGMVHGRRGRGGGFTLRCDPDRTTLLDVVNVIDPLERITTCPLGREAHRNKLCPLHSRLDEVIGILSDSLNEMTIQDVIDGAKGPTLCRAAPVRMRVSARRSSKKKSRKSTTSRRRRKKTRAT